MASHIGLYTHVENERGLDAFMQVMVQKINHVKSY